MRPLLQHVPKGVAAGTIAALAKVANTQASVAVTGGSQVRYDMGAHGFTDDIVLSSASSGSVYRVTMRLPKGAHASQSNNGVLITDSAGNQLATYTGGVAYDAVAAAASPDGMSAPGGTTTPVAISLISHGAGVAVVSVSIYAAWLADLKRVFPVVIDPTFSGGTATSTTTTDEHLT